jgi:hypothetical protein
MRDYIPVKYVLLIAWLTNFVDYLTQNISRFGIESDTLNAYQVYVDAFRAAHARAELPNAGKADRLDRREKAQAVTKATRDFVNTYLRFNKAVTDEDRVKLGLTVPDQKPTHSSAPGTMIDVDRIDTSVIMRLSIHYKDRERQSRGKPEHVHGAEICSAILDHKPATTDELTHSDFSAHSPFTFIFDEDRRGKTLWFHLRWENPRGEKGPWSELYYAVIP